MSIFNLHISKLNRRGCSQPFTSSFKCVASLLACCQAIRSAHSVGRVLTWQDRFDIQTTDVVDRRRNIFFTPLDEEAEKFMCALIILL